MKILSCILLVLSLAACTSGGEGSDKGVSFKFPDLSDIHPYIANSTYSNQLKTCVNISSSGASCSLSTLPLIGMEFDQPSIEQIMQRVVVSHDWMGQRFQEYLNEAPTEILTLLKTTSAIVIADNIRPAYFLDYSGAIYLDPSFLWLTNEEKTDVSKDTDYRTSFGNNLPFKHYTRNLIDSNNAYIIFSLNNDTERTLEDTIISTSRLLLHELAHANDCVQTQNMMNISEQQTYYNYIIKQKNGALCAYQKLTNLSPLSSSIWKSLGKVLFKGYEVTADQITMSPRTTGEAFAADNATDFYSYATSREDTAIAFEVLMLKKLFNVDRDVIIYPNSTKAFCDNKIDWGERGRLATPSIYERSEFVTELMLPDMDLSTFYQTLPAVFEIPEGTDICTKDFGQGTLNASSTPLNNEVYSVHEEIPFL